jgi:membrane protease YdiL (CAAX protease family)
MEKRMADEANRPQAQYVGSDYWSQSRRPLVSLYFAGPLLLIYELGLICLGPNAMRNGAEAWLRQMLDLLGFNAYFLLPLLTIGILLGWHHVLRQSWQVSSNVLYGMAGECLSMAVGLWFSWWLLSRFILQAVSVAIGPRLAGSHAAIACLLDIGHCQQVVARFLGTISCYLGAGIYEELLFRLILLNLAVGLLVWLRAGRRASMIGGIILSSALFSAAHYIGPSGDPLSGLTFVFRFLAGVFFALLYRYRGFGIAAGTHAFYDVLVGFSKLAT